MDLKEIQKPVSDLLAETNAILVEKARSNIRLLSEMGELTPLAKGKKIRSTLLFLLAGMSECFSGDLPSIAASLEMFHLSSLIHDDILDNSEQRRGQKTLNTNMGNFRSVLWGDYLFINAFSTLHNLGKPVLVDITFNAAKLMVEGQIIEVQNAYNFAIDIPTYLDIINRKTSSLFAAVAHTIAVLTKDSPQSVDQYIQFGTDFGTTFQIRDDIMDIFSEQSGKDRFRDLGEGKMTLPYILLLQKSDRDIRKIYLKGKQAKLLKMCREFGIEELCNTEMEFFHRRCLGFMEHFPPSQYKEALYKLLDFIKARDY